MHQNILCFQGWTIETQRTLLQILCNSPCWCLVSTAYTLPEHIVKLCIVAWVISLHIYTHASSLLVLYQIDIMCTLEHKLCNSMSVLVTCVHSIYLTGQHCYYALWHGSFPCIYTCLKLVLPDRFMCTLEHKLCYAQLE